MRNFKLKNGIIFPLTLAILVSFFGFTYISPSQMYFRGWEYFDDFVYTGFKDGEILIEETGDSSRGYLFQRYKSRNMISVNEFGNRKSLYGNSEKYDVLAVGDSQLFGSGVSDGETFTSQLNLQSRHKVYNASRVNGFSILNSNEIDQEWRYVIISSTERNGFNDFCPNYSFQLPNSIPSKIEKQSNFSLGYLVTYLSRMQGWVDQKYSTFIAGRFFAPENRIISNQHSFNQKNFDADLRCITQIDSAVRSADLVPIFMLFPSNQSIYPEDASVLPDAFTLNYIRNLSQVASSKGIVFFDSMDCLDKSKKVVSQTHDTHLNAAGYSALAACMSSFITSLTSP